MTRFGPFCVDAHRRRLARGEREIHLTPKAFDLLSLLIAEAPRVVRKAELHDRLWQGTFVSDATLVGLVKELRRALDDHDARSPIIRTAHRVGYAFCAPLDAAMPRQAGVSRWIVVGGRRVVLVDGDNPIGRDPTAAVWVDASGVSRRHARITIEGSLVTLEDLGSKNGTSLNDMSLTRPTALHDGDRIQVGPVVMLFHASVSGMSTETIMVRPALNT